MFGNEYLLIPKSITMKKAIYLLIVLCLFVFSCKKEHSSQPDNKLYKVTFNVSGFTQGTTVFSAKGNSNRKIDALQIDALSDNVTNLVYAVFDASGNFVHNIYQNSSTATNFGTITDNLAAGTYTIVFVAGQDLLYGYGTYEDPTDPSAALFSTLSSAQIFYKNYDGDDLGDFQDTFYKKLSLTVSTTSTSQAITLDRINGELELYIKDALPANAASIEFSTVASLEYSIATSSPLAPLSGYSLNAESNIPADSAGVSNYNFSAIVLNTTQSFTVNIYCYDVNGNVIAQRIVDNVSCQVNKKTILTGSLFGGPTGGSITGGFSISIDTAWNPVKVNVPFVGSIRNKKVNSARLIH